jgi:hypothetical protein
MRGRRRRRLAAEGREPEEDPPLIDAGDRPWTLAERMRRRFELRRLSMEQLRMRGGACRFMQQEG